MILQEKVQELIRININKFQEKVLGHSVKVFGTSIKSARILQEKVLQLFWEKVGGHFRKI